MPLTTQQIYDLNNSMVAAQNVSLGTLLSGYTVSKVASGSLIPTSASTLVYTGLTTASFVLVSLGGSPVEAHVWTSACVIANSGSIVIKCWMPTNASTVTPVISTGSVAAQFTKVDWIAVGE